MTPHKVRVAFLLVADLSTFWGSERFVYEFLRHAPRDEIEAVVVEPSYQPRAILNREELTKLLPNVSFTRVSSFERQLSLFRGSRLATILCNVVVRPFLQLTILRAKNAAQLELVSQCDIVYLIRNRDVYMFRPTSAILIGSDHGGLPDPRTRSFGIMRLAPWFRRLTGIHVFPNKEDVLELFGKPLAVAVPNGVDSGRFSPGVNHRKEDSVSFFYLARLEPAKGVLTLLQAWRLRDQSGGASLTIAGTGALASEVARSRDIRFLGRLSETEVPEAYREADVFVYPTRGDPFPLVILEALASGLYVITSDALKGTFDEFEKLGFLEYCPNDPSELARRMLDATLHADQIRERRNRVHEFISERYGWEAVSRKLLDFFKQCASARQARRLLDSSSL